MNRPGSLTPDVARQIAAHVGNGATLKEAAALVGVSVRSIHNWQARGRQTATHLADQHGLDRPEDIRPGDHYTPDQMPHVHFVHLLTRAREARVATLVSRVDEATRGQRIVKETTTEVTDSTGAVTEKRTVREVRDEPGDWRAAAWLLERVAPERFGRRERVEHTGAGGEPVKITTVDERRERVQATLVKVGSRLLPQGGDEPVEDAVIDTTARDGDAGDDG